MAKEKKQENEEKPIRARFTKELIELMNRCLGEDEKNDSKSKNKKMRKF